MLLPLTVLIQWLIIGAFTGLWLRHQNRRTEKRDAYKSPLPTPASGAPAADEPVAPPPGAAGR
jgi:hypothetical protein